MSDGYAPGRENIPSPLLVQARPGMYGAPL